MTNVKKEAAKTKVLNLPTNPTPTNPTPTNPTPIGSPAPQIDPTQPVETNAYVPTYKIKPDFKKALLTAIGDRPFNEIAGLIQAIDVETIDHQTLTQIMNAIGQFPFVRVENLMKNVNIYVEQIVQD